MPFSDPEGRDIQLVARFVREECIDYHECIRLDPTWAIHGNIYEGISEIYHKFRYSVLGVGPKNLIHLSGGYFFNNGKRHFTKRSNID